MPVSPNSSTDDLAADPGAGPAIPAGQAPRRGRRLLRWSAWSLLAALALVLVTAAAMIGWLWHSDAGSIWLLERIPGVRIEAVQGNLNSGQMRLGRLVWEDAGDMLELSGIGATGLKLKWHPRPDIWLGISADALHAERVVWRSAPSTGRPARVPQDLRLPLTVDSPHTQADEVQIDDLPAFTQVSGAVQLGADDGRLYRIDDLTFNFQRMAGQGNATLGTLAPLPLQARLALRSAADVPRPWQAQASLEGPLDRLGLRADLSGTPLPGRPVPALHAEAVLLPFAVWSLGELRASTRELDLSALALQAPVTRLTGAITWTGNANQPLAADVRLNNQNPGRWDQGRLPIRFMRLQLQGDTPRATPAATSAAAQSPQLPQPPAFASSAPLHPHADAAAATSPLTRLVLRAVSIELAGDGDTPAGRLEGQGQWRDEPARPGRDSVGQGSAPLTAQFQFIQLRPAMLDKRLPAMTLSGPLNLRASHLPALARISQTDAAAWSNLLVDLSATLNGHIEAAQKAPSAVQLGLDAQLGRRRVEIRQATVAASTAQAALRGLATLDERARWQWQAQADLHHFDPGVWWPAVAAPRGGATQLNLALQTSGSLPDQALHPASGAAHAVLTQIAGNANAILSDSTWAGVPVQGRASLEGAWGAAQLKAELLAAGNAVHVNGQPRADNVGAWEINVEAPALASLAPLLASIDGASGWAPTTGSLSGRARLSADHPAGWEIHAQSLNLTTPRLHLASAQINGQGQASLDGPLNVDIQTRGLAQGRNQVDLLNISARGSLRRHEISLTVESPARPPAWFEQMMGTRTRSGSRFEWFSRGEWHPLQKPSAAPPQAFALWPVTGSWQSSAGRLLAVARDGSGQPWLAAQDLAITLNFDAQGHLDRVAAEPGKLTLPGTTLVWSEALYQTRPGVHPLFSLQARLEPFMLAPMMNRAQPDIGWRGDLTLAGDIQLRGGDRFDADVVFERRSGDISIASNVRDPTAAVRPMGLTDLRIALAAHDGTWHFTQALAGRQLGEMSGVATLQTSADAVWPAPATPLQGALQMHVADLGAWGIWIPPGWRLGGDLKTTAFLGGRLNDPQFTGQLNGRLLTIRNALMGVDLSNGEIDAILSGDSARIEHLVFQGGKGRLTATGEATLGAQPRARLHLDAEHFQLLGRLDRRIVTTGTARIDLAADLIATQADLLIDEGLIDLGHSDGPSLDDDVNVIEEGTASADAAATARRQSTLNARIDLGPNLRLKGRGLNALLRGDLALTNPAGRLAVRGTVRVEQGTYAAYGQKLDIERGILTFQGPVDDPRLDIFAIRPNLDVTVGVAVTGSALNPRVRLASQPEMSDTAKLSWLVLGREPSELGQADTALLQRAALALWAGEGVAPTDAMLRQLGITDFNVRQNTNGDNRETVISLGRQLSKRWYFGYERGVNAAAGTWQLIYRAAQRFTLRAQSGEENALDLIWSWRWP